MAHANLSPFDPIAEQYDATFTQTRLAFWLRDLVHAHMPFQRGQSILELGCGTGVDALWMADNAINVLATDASLQMVNLTQAKAQNADLSAYIQTQQLDLNNLTDINRQFDGVLANFGVINCVLDRRQLAHYLARHVHRGGRLILIVMGPICLWEIGWYLLHGRPKAAIRRLRGRIHAHVGDGHTIMVEYPSVGKLQREFSPYFQTSKVLGIGGLLPPSYLSYLVDRYPRLFNKLNELDRTLTSTPLWPYFSDHYLIEFERL